jgi:hypothetical protein
MAMKDQVNATSAAKQVPLAGLGMQSAFTPTLNFKKASAAF